MARAEWLLRDVIRGAQKGQGHTGQDGNLCVRGFSGSCVDNRVQGGHEPGLGQTAQLRGDCKNPMVDKRSHYLQKRAGKVHVLE